MANQQRGDVEITLGGKTYTMRPTFDAIAQIEKRTGIGVMPLGRKFFNQAYGLREAAITVEEGIAAADGEAPENVGELLRKQGLSDLDMSGALTTFFAYAISGDDKGDEAKDSVARYKAEREKKSSGEAPPVA